MSIEEMIEQMHRAPDPACEVVTLERVIVEQMLNELEHKGPLDPLVTYLRLNLSLPKVELWAMHSVGPGEVFPALDRAHAEKMVQDMKECEQREKQRLIDSNSPSLQYWCDWVVNIIPSPYEPDEHFQMLAAQALEEEDRLRAGWAKAGDDRDKLLLQMHLIADIAEGSTTANSLPNIGRIAREVIAVVTAEEVARAKELAERKARLEAAGERALAKISPAEGGAS